MDGSGAWWNHNLAIGFRSLMISIENPHGWNMVFPNQFWVEYQVE